MPESDPDLDEHEVAGMIALIQEHPLYIEAQQFPHCLGPDFLALEKSSIDRMRIEETPKQEILSSLSASDEKCPTLSFCTATKRPEHLFGGGNLYMFFFSPDRARLLHAGIGTWRA